MNFTTQIHDFDPGFGRPVGNHLGRTFWTVAVPENDVHVNFAAGTAEMHVHNLALRDYGNIPTALGPNFRTAFDPATVSFDVVWNPPVTQRLHILDGENGNDFSGRFNEDQVTVTWSGRNLATGFRFHANPGDLGTSVDTFAELGRERNGIFAPPDGDSPGPPAPHGDGTSRYHAF